MMKTARHPSAAMIATVRPEPTTGPKNPPATSNEDARARSVLLNQRPTKVIEAGKIGPSPTPNKARTPAKLKNDEHLVVMIVKSDHEVTAVVITTFGLKTPARIPAGICIAA